MTKRLVSCLAVGVSALAMAAPAIAQDVSQAGGATTAPQEAPQGAQPDASDIVVTASRIARDGYTAPTPLTVATVQDLARTTPSSIQDGLNKLPQFSNSLSPSKSASNFSNSPIHGNVLNLRGLGTPGANPKGPLRTLVLFDGVRISPTEYVGTIDTNVLPQLLMQRVDVVTGGASAQWGSDAVAGVVNFVLDKNFTGLKGVAQVGGSERGDNYNQRLGVAWGTGFAGGRGHILLSAEYSNNDGMLRSDRASSEQGYAFVGSVVGCTVPTGQPSSLCAPGGALNPYTIGSNVRISALSPNGRITGSSVAGNPFVGQVINNNGTTRPFNTGTAVGSSGFQSGGDGYTIPTTGNAVIPLATKSAFGRLSYELSDNITAYVQGLYSRSDVKYRTQVNALVPSSQGVNIYKGNPYLSAALDASLATASDFITVGQYNAGQELPMARERTDYWMATAGLDGKVGNFGWKLNYTHGDSVHTLNNSGLYNSRNLYAAADVVLVNGTPTCRVLTTPQAGQFAGCQPLDVLHGNPQASTPGGYAYATGESRYRAVIRQDSVAGTLTGSLFDLPAGPVDIAVGAEYRRQTLGLTSNADPALLDTPAERSDYFNGLRGVPATTQFYWLTNVGSAQGSMTVKEAFAEVAVPILKDTPFFQELSLSGAVRYTDYSTSGGVTTWKIGGTWRPVSDFLVRAIVSRDIRAPNLFELFAGSQSGIGIINDFQISNGGTPVYGSGLNQNVNTVTSGNRNLKPEVAKTFTVGGVLTPSFLPGASLSVDYYSIRVDGLIDSLSAQQLVTNCFNSGGSGVQECAFITRATPTSLPSLVTLVPSNTAFLKTAGIDIDASYRTQIGDNPFSVRLYANYLSKFDAQQYPGAPIARYAGVSVVGSNPAAFPRWRGNLSVDYSIGRFGVTIAEQYIHKMRLDIPGGAVPIQFVNPHVPAVWYTDLSLRYTIPHASGNVEIFGNVNNLFDRSPPRIPGTVPGVNLPTNIAIYDFIGRAFTAGVRFKF